MDKKDISSDFDFDDIISKVKERVGPSSEVKSKAKGRKGTRGKIANIIDFMYGNDFLRFSAVGMNLTMVQGIIIKCFYKGSEGNEDILLTDQERQWLIDWKEGKSDEKKNVIDLILQKHDSNSPINELVLVLGRRSGKTLLSSIIATYEAYKCLELGNPQEYFGLAASNPIIILNIATAKPQAGLLYEEIKSRIRYSKYFHNKINQVASNSEYTYLLTDFDKEQNEILIREGRGHELIKGSIIIQCGHSNSNSLMGSGVICLIFDELAYFADSSGKMGGEKVYGDLVPNTKAFRHPDGRIASRVVSISAPAGRSGIFYLNFKTSMTVEGKSMMSFQFPTWECSPQIKSKDQLAAEFKKNPADAEIRYGAEFSGAMSSIFFPQDCIDECINHNLINNEKGQPYIRYFMHVDPALSNHNYALAILHEERYLNKELKENRRRIVVDHVKFWQPTRGADVKIADVEKYIIGLCSKFNVVSITFDDWNSASTIQNFRRKGLPVRRTGFRSRYKQLIFGELRDLVISGDIQLIPNDVLIGEFKNLQCRITASGFKVFPNVDCEYPTDDILDCVAGGAHVALESGVNELPKAESVYLNLGSNGRIKGIFDSVSTSTYGK